MKPSDFTASPSSRRALLTLAMLSLAGCGKEAPEAPAIPSTPLAAVNTPKPDYPIELACANVGGTSVFSVQVGTEGRPVAVKLLSSSGQPALDAAAEKAVHTWEFEAATRNGQPVPQGIQVPVRFTPPAERPNECFQLDEKK